MLDSVSLNRYSRSGEDETLDDAGGRYRGQPARKGGIPVSVRTLVGEYDGTKAAVMVDSANGTAFGPVFEGAESGEQVEAFQAWLRLLPFTFEGVADEIGFDIGDLPTGGDGDDPRDWPESGLTKLVAYWRENFLDEIGYLKDDVSDG